MWLAGNRSRDTGKRSLTISTPPKSEKLEIPPTYHRPDDEHFVPLGRLAGVWRGPDRHS